jgi:D-alanyl-D-alanine carboxypeptidase (penicillin-binding protein 5/6)
VAVNAPVDLNITAKSAILMEASTGQVLYEKNPDEKLSPASITKIMTLILIFDALESGKINMTDVVTTSEYAKSMGGSQVFLEEGEEQTVETLIKCIVVASGNDASVAMAEYIAGSENEFVKLMNARAQTLNLKNTHFMDCTGLSNDDNHYSSARDVGIMSKELITKYPKIKEYSSIWMENITHVTNKGSSEFGLANTNKLLKQYSYTTGLKTGSTDKAKYCVSATALKDDVEMIAVIMAADNYKLRFSEAKTLLEYGYNSCYLYKDKENNVGKIGINGGENKEISYMYNEQFSYICNNQEMSNNITKKEEFQEKLEAPIKKNDVIGKCAYYYGEKIIGEVDIIATENCEKADYAFYLLKIINKFLSF